MSCPKTTKSTRSIFAVNIRPFDQTSLNNKLFITGTKIPPINVKRKKITTLTGVFVMYNVLMYFCQDILKIILL